MLDALIQRPNTELDYGMADERSLAEIKTLLAANKLPCADVEKHINHFVVASRQGAIVGSAGLEVHGNYGLLRSVCVDETLRNRNVGSKLCDLVEAHARNVGIEQLYLLTNTAERFFARRGFLTAPRDSAPLAIKQTEEFRSLCPATATCMSRRLEDGALFTKRVPPLPGYSARRK